MMKQYTMNRLAPSAAIRVGSSGDNGYTWCSYEFDSLVAAWAAFRALASDDTAHRRYIALRSGLELEA